MIPWYRYSQLARKWTSLTLAIIMLASFSIPSSLLSHAEASPAPHVVFSQVYVAGGNTGAVYNTKFFELYNPTDRDIELNGWSIQYAAKTGAFNSKPDTFNNKTLSGTIKAHGYYLVTGTSNTRNGVPLPIAADIESPINPSQSYGKLALVRGTEAITGKDDPNVVDFLTWADTASNKPNEYWGDPLIAPAPGSNEPYTGQAAFQKGTILRKTNDGTDPRTVTGRGNGWFTKNPAEDFVVSAVKDPSDSSTIRNSHSAPQPALTLVTPAPDTGRIGLENHFSTVTQSVYSVVYGELGSVSQDALVNIYLIQNGQYTGTASGKADGDGSFSFTFDNPTDQKSVYVSATLAGYEESRMVRVDAQGHDPSGSVVPLAQVRVNGSNGEPINKGAVVTVEGIVTVDNNRFDTGSSNFFIEDGTGGIRVVKGVDHHMDIKAGNRLRITGSVDFANGLTLLVPQSIQFLANEPLPRPLQLTIADLNRYDIAEPNEGRLAALHGTVTQITASGFNTNVIIANEQGQTTTVRIYKGTGIDVAQKLKVKQSYIFTGVIGQYKTSAPYDSGYELYPRDASDILGHLQIEHRPITTGYIGADLTFEATVNHADSVSLYYRQPGSASYTALTMTSADGYLYKAVLQAANVTGTTVEYYIHAEAGSQTAQAGSPQAPIVIKLMEDKDGPVYSEAVPADQSQSDNKRPDISVRLLAPSGIDAASIQVRMNGTVMPITFDEATGLLRVKLDADLKPTSYKVEVEAKDKKGNTSKFTWTFQVLQMFSGGHHYRGSTHNHTGISHDANGTLEKAIIAAKQHDYDWFAFTDHSHDIDKASRDAQDSINHGGMPERTGASQWQTLKRVADDSTVDGQFVAFRSYEMTSTNWGHTNIFGTDNFIDRVQDQGIYQDLNQLYKWVKVNDSLVGQFNHPNWGGKTAPFNGFVPYDKEIDKRYTMFEVGNGSGQYTYSNIESLYYKTLDLGWHIAPTFGEDHHNERWGETMRRTVVVADQLTRESLLDAMRNRRVYMSENPNFTLDVTANGHYMGSIVDSRSLTFDISGGTSDQPYTYVAPGFKPDERIKKVELITNHAQVINSITPETHPSLFTKGNKHFTWNPKVEVLGGQQWFLVKVTLMDGSQVYASPIWSKEVDVDVKIQDIQALDGSMTADNPAVLEAWIGNFGQGTIDQLQVNFYVDQVDSSHFIDSAIVKGLAPKSTSRVQATWKQPVSGGHTIIAVIANPPAGNATENNQYEQAFYVKPPLGITILFDAAHGNENSSTDNGKYKDEMKKVTKLLRSEGYTVRENTQPLTSQSLEQVSVLAMTHPNKSKPLTESEQAAIAEFVQNGGSLILASKSNNSADPTMNNALLEKIGSVIQVNDDGVYDGSTDGNFWSNPAASLWSVRAHPEPVANYMTDFVRRVDYYSGASLMKLGNQPLTNEDPVTILARGNTTSYQFNLRPNGLAYDVTDATAGGSVLPLVAAQEIGSGRIIVTGMNVINDRQLDDTGEKNDNVRLASNMFNWLAHRGTEVLPIRDARKLSEGTSIVVEGTVTSAAGVFFDAFYVQDETGGIMAFNEVPKDALQLGDTVRIYGNVKVFENNVEIMFDKFEKNVLKLNRVPGQPLEPKAIPTGEAHAENNQGMLVKLKGVVKRVASIPDHTIYIDDGTGEALIFIDGYITGQSGQPPELKPGDTLEAVGLTGKFSGGYWVRVRDTKELKKLSGPKEPGGGIDPNPGGNPGGNNSGNNPSGTGGSGSAKLSHQMIITAKDLDNAAQGGKQVSFAIQDGVTDILMPIQIGDKLASKGLELRASQWTALIPAGSLQAAAKSASKEDLLNGKLTLQIQSLQDWIKQAQARNSNSGLTLTGTAYAIKLTLTNHKGESVSIDKLSSPITFSVKLEGKPTLNLVGIYAINKNDSLIYMGGTVKSGEVSILIGQLGQYAVLEYIQRYSDVADSHWAHGVIQEMTAKQYVKGTGGTTFEPGRSVTRAEFTAMLVQAFGFIKQQQVLDGAISSFSDVPANKWYAESIAAAVQAGIATGSASNRFNPDEAITRQEMAAMLIRAYGAASGKAVPQSSAISYTDAAQISPWAAAYVAAAQELSLLQGRSEKKFEPNVQTSRAEAVQAIANGLHRLP